MARGCRALKVFVKKHPHLLMIARKMLGRKLPILLTWSDIYLLTEDWCKTLPSTFDCVIGVPRGGLIIADVIALNFGVPLSSPENFVRGEVWQSRSLPIREFKKVLLVDDCVDQGRSLLRIKKELETKFPGVIFAVASLVKVGRSVCTLDYVYVSGGVGMATDVKTKFVGEQLKPDLRVTFDDIG